MDVVTLLDLIQQGYYATYPLLLCSIVALAIAGERLWAFRGLDARMRLLPLPAREGAAIILDQEGVTRHAPAVARPRPAAKPSGRRAAVPGP